MNMGVEDGCDTGLVLGLGYSKASSQQDPSPKLEPTVTIPNPLEPSLTLGLSDDTHRPTTAAKDQHGLARQSSSLHSTLSSFSAAYPLSMIKRENDMVNEESERAFSRASDEEEEGGAKKKLRLTKEQSALLEDKFKEHSTLNPKQKQALARQLNLRPRQVEVWFQNRRARTKLKQTEVDCEVLKRCCETLSDENRRLQKELEELRALKLAPPMYMQFPAGSLTVCPSCERVAGAPNGTKPNPFVQVVPKAQFLNPFTRSAAC